MTCQAEEPAFWSRAPCSPSHLGSPVAMSGTLYHSMLQIFQELKSYLTFSLRGWIGWLIFDFPDHKLSPSCLPDYTLRTGNNVVGPAGKYENRKIEDSDSVLLKPITLVGEKVTDAQTNQKCRVTGR